MSDAAESVEEAPATRARHSILAEGRADVTRGAESDDFSKHSDRGIHSLTQSVTDEASRPLSEVDENSSCASSSLREAEESSGSREDREEVTGSEQKGEIESEGFRGVPPGADGSEKLLADEAGRKSEEKISNCGGKDPQLEKSDSCVTEVGAAVSDLGGDGADSAERPEVLDSEAAGVGDASPQRLSDSSEQGSVINPYSLEDRIRKAREYQDLTLELQTDDLADARALTENFTSDSPSQAPVQELASVEERAVVSPLGAQVQVKERRRAEVTPADLAASSKGGDRFLRAKTGAGEAFLVGAIASGVNKPTWVAVRVVLVALVASLLFLLYVAVRSDSWFVLVSVLFLIAIAGGLILLLSWYISVTGLVSVDQQMAELNHTGKVESKTA